MGVVQRLKLGGAKLARLFRRAEKPAPAAHVPGIAEITDFGANPGALRMFVHTARAPAPGAPVIVLLHGCRQHAVPFAEEAGWFELAARTGAILVIPAQSESNNRWRCFNWFRPGDTKRGMGEAASIRAMTDAAIVRYHADPARIFAAGLSAGGAMTAALLASYPDVFAAGAVVAGLPARCAKNAIQATQRMARPGPALDAHEWSLLLRAYAPENFAGPWPRITIWHGLKDKVVASGNAAITAAQWIAVHNLDPTPTTETLHAHGLRHQTWGAASLAPVELWTIAGMDHGFPIDPATAGRTGPWVLDAGIPAAEHIARFWGLIR